MSQIEDALEMVRRKIIYYHPRAIRENPDRGSDLRVAKILGALQQLDYEVIVVAGDAITRHRKIKELKSQIRAGLKIEYVYGESTNAPIIFADKRLIPSNFILDYAFFAWLKKKEIPFGLFYRDVQWRFDFFKKQLRWPFSILLKPLYYLDWYMYNKYCTLLFLPSEAMNLHLPRKRQEHAFHPLPPGFDTNVMPRGPFDLNSYNSLKLLYVGGIEPTIYNISELLEVVAARSDVRLTICCRYLEWKRYGHMYEPYMADNIELVHASNEQLAHHYHQSDIFLMLTGYSKYMDFAMPVKFSEAIGYAVPIVTLNQKEIARHIRTAGIGWVINSLDELDNLLTEISANRSMLSKKYEKLLSLRHVFSWKARAAYIDRCLSQD